MARILPQVGSAFKSRTPRVQVFRPGRKPPEKSDAQKASEVLAAINQGLGVAQGAYNLGKGIYQDFQPTEAELLEDRRQAAVASRLDWMEAGRPSQVVPPGSLVARQEQVDRVAAPGQTEFLSDFATGVPVSQPISPLGSEEGQRQLSRFAETGQTSSPLQAAMVEPTPTQPPPPAPIDVMGGARDFLASRGVPTSQPAPTATPPMPTREGAGRAIAALTEAGRPDLAEKYKKNVMRLYVGAGGKAEDLTTEQRFGIAAKAQDAARQPAQGWLPTEVTADQFIERNTAGDPFSISDLASSYGALMNAGREPEARELLRMAKYATDYAGFITTSRAVPRLVESKAQDAIKKGFTPRKPGEGGVFTYEDAADILKLGKKKKSSGGKSKKSKKGGKGGDGDVGGAGSRLRQVLTAIQTSDAGREEIAGLSDAQVLSRYKTVAPSIANGEIVIPGVDDTVAHLKGTFGVDVRAKAATEKAAREAAAAAVKAKSAQAGLIEAADKAGVSYPTSQDQAKALRASVETKLATAERKSVNWADMESYATAAELDTSAPLRGEVIKKHKQAVLSDRAKQATALNAVLNALKRAYPGSGD